MNETKYTVNKADNQLLTERLFNAPVALVWRAWTEAELLDQWWAPKPWKAETKQMDFREGGSWLYAMCGPEGEKHWGKAEYAKIVKEEYYIGEDVFCDENGNTNADLPGTVMHVSFHAQGKQTLVKVTATYVSAEAVEQIIAMGFKEGFAMAHKNLDALLVQLS